MSMRRGTRWVDVARHQPGWETQNCDSKQPSLTEGPHRRYSTPVSLWTAREAHPNPCRNARSLQKLCIHPFFPPRAPPNVARTGWILVVVGLPGSVDALRELGVLGVLGFHRGGGLPYDGAGHEASDCDRGSISGGGRCWRGGRDTACAQRCPKPPNREIAHVRMIQGGFAEGMVTEEGPGVGAHGLGHGPGDEAVLARRHVPLLLLAHLLGRLAEKPGPLLRDPVHLLRLRARVSPSFFSPRCTHRAGVPHAHLEKMAGRKLRNDHASPDQALMIWEPTLKNSCREIRPSPWMMSREILLPRDPYPPSMTLSR